MLCLISCDKEFIDSNISVCFSSTKMILLICNVLVVYEMWTLSVSAMQGFVVVKTRFFFTYFLGCFPCNLRQKDELHKMWMEISCNFIKSETKLPWRWRLGWLLNCWNWEKWSFYWIKSKEMLGFHAMCFSHFNLTCYSAIFCQKMFHLQSALRRLEQSGQ